MLVLTMIASGTLPGRAQQPTHYRYQMSWPPGSIGWQQLQRGGPMRGYFQPVEIRGPDGVEVELAVDGSFQKRASGPVLAGMQIGQVYRLRVTRIPQLEGAEVFPTIEVIDRLYPPQGKKARFPIPVHLTREELEMAVRGQYVTRVIYLENPTTAFPEEDKPDFQRYFEVRPDADPLKQADELGRPVAILRMGSRVPGPQGPDAKFLYGSPALEFYASPQTVEQHNAAPPDVVPADPDPTGIPLQGPRQ